MKKISLLAGAAALATIGGVFAAWTAFDMTKIETESNVKIGTIVSTEEIDVLGKAKLTLKTVNAPSIVVMPSEATFANFESNEYEFESDDVLFQLEYEIDGASDMYESELNLYNLEVKLSIGNPVAKDPDCPSIANYDYGYEPGGNKGATVFVPASEDGISVVDVTAEDFTNAVYGYIFLGQYSEITEDYLNEFFEAVENTEFTISMEIIDYGV